MAQLIARCLLMLPLLLVTQTGLGSEQSARWLNNTFRIDPSISAVTLLIEREPGDEAVILIRPDGSKYYQHRHPDHVSWFSTANRDVITLRQPEPGPWQATGIINKNRSISLLSEFELALTPVAERLYQQEVLKLNAELRHDDARLDANYYLQDLSLQAQLIDLESDPDTRTPPEPLVVGQFLDDGLGLDAHPGDGKLTAEAIIDTLPGEYLFQALISNQVLARAREQSVFINPMPIQVHFSTPDAQGQWHLELTADKTLAADTLVIIGELTTPSGRQIPVSGSGERIELPKAQKDGEYYWQGRAFVTTQEGREIQLNLPRQRIHENPPVIAAAGIAPGVAADVDIDGAGDGDDKPMPLTYQIAAGIILVLMLLLVGWFLRKRAVGKRQNSEEQPS
ncbi:hypothetical protein [Oceanisphaera sp.]|uniref:hypothetical protein n=1 Tax=Oceanisphaera sp. TaxID=1929979 RepID=UPI003A8FA12A